MKKTFVLIVVLLTVFSGLAEAQTTKKAVPSAKATGMVFFDAPWAKVLERARKEKKLIFFDAYTSWCGPCKKMQSTVFTRTDVGAFYNQNFINVKKDMEEGEGPLLAQTYPLEGYPTMFFIDGNGKVIMTQLGAIPSDKLIALGKSVLKK